MTKKKPKPMLARVLETYINVTNKDELEAWIDKQPAGEGRKFHFINDCCLVLEGQPLVAIGQLHGERIERYRHERDCYDYIDSMRTLKPCTGLNVGG